MKFLYFSLFDKQHSIILILNIFKKLFTCILYMSIKVGYLNENYSYNNVRNSTTALLVNSFDDSNVILLNTEKNTKADVFINYKNIISTGLSSNDYIFRDLQNNKTLLMINSSNTTLYNDMQVKSFLSISDNGTQINSNVSIRLLGTDDSFVIENTSNTLLRVTSNFLLECQTNDFSLKNTNNNMLLHIDTSNTAIYNNLYVNSGILYTSRISALPGQTLNIDNATYNSTEVEKLKALKTLTVKNMPNDKSDSVSLEIYKNQGTTELVTVNTCNLNQITNNFIITNDGSVGIGNKTPNASLSIKKISDNIISYDGTEAGDTFRLTKRGDVGIGTTNIRAQLHVRRTDLLSNSNEFRRNPMVNLEMNYIASNNVSNILKSANTTFGETSQNIPKLYANTKVTSNLTNGLNVTVDNTIYLLNDTIFTGAFMNNNIDNISNIILTNAQTIDMYKFERFSLSPDYNIQINNKLVFPSGNTIQFYNAERGLINDPVFEAYYLYVMMSLNTYNNGGYNTILGPGYNASNFTSYNPLNPNLPNTPINKLDKTIYTYQSYDYRCKIDFIIEKNLLQAGNMVVSYPFTYQTIQREQLPAPNFMNISYNNAFISSLSPHGTLSLGSQVPDANKLEYLLYAPGQSLMNTLKVNVIDANQTNDISFNQKNIKNVNTLQCQNLQAANLTMHNITATSILMDTGGFSNLQTSNLMFYNANNNYLAFSNINVHFNTRCSIGKSRELSNSSCLKITVDNQIVPSIYATTFYTNHAGISILNDTSGVNPSLRIQTINSTDVPYIHLNNSTSAYYFRIINDNFQIVTNHFDTLSARGIYLNNIRAPKIIQHVKQYNTLTFGENDLICIDCETRNYTTNTNSSSTVSIGIPFQKYGASTSPENHIQKFNDDIKPNSYMLNVFGNTKIANINDDPMVTAITTDNKIYTAVNGHPDNINEFRVYGTACSSNANIYDTVSCTKLITSNLINAYEVKCSKLNMSSDGEIMTSNILTSNIINHDSIKTKTLECTSNIISGDLLIYIPDKGYVNLSTILVNNGLV